jgi:hypothetical protein
MPIIARMAVPIVPVPPIAARAIIPGIAVIAAIIAAVVAIIGGGIAAGEARQEHRACQ